MAQHSLPLLAFDATPAEAAAWCDELRRLGRDTGWLRWYAENCGKSGPLLNRLKELLRREDCNGPRLHRPEF